MTMHRKRKKYRIILRFLVCTVVFMVITLPELKLSEEKQNRLTSVSEMLNLDA